MSKKFVLYAALTAMILGSSTPTSALDRRECVLAPIFVFLGASAYALSYQHPVSNFKQKGEWKGLLNARQLLNDPKAYGRNASDVFWTKWVGQPFKDKELKANLETGKIKQSTRKMPAGVMGWTNTYVYTGVKAGKFLSVLGGAYLFLTHPEIVQNLGTYLATQYGFRRTT